MTSESVILVPIIQEITQSMIVKKDDVVLPINYEPGRSSQILKALYDYNNSPDFKNFKYPLLAMVMPSRVERGGDYYGIAIIERIVIATLTNSTDNVLQRYEEGGTFKSILYPCYYEFLRRLSYSTKIIGNDPDAFSHTVMDVPGVQPLGSGLTDYIDAIEILNLKLTLNQIKTC